MKAAGAAVLLLVACSARPVPDAGTIEVRYPKVPTAGGPVLDGAQLVAVTFTGDPHAGSHRDFVTWLAKADGWLVTRGAEYGITAVSASPAVELPAPASPVSDAQLQALLAPLSSGAQTLFVVFLPAHTALIDRHGVGACHSNPGAGYHEVTDAHVAYVALPGCHPRFSAVLDYEGSLHLDAARLALDALTDPQARNAPAYGITDSQSPWTALGSEVGDFCFGRFADAEGHTLQRVWSNAAVARADEPCQPAKGGPRFGVSVTPGAVQAMGVQSPVQFTVTGWALDPVADFRVDVTPWVGDFAIQAMLDVGTLSDGRSAQLTVSVPYPVPQGTFGAVLLTARGDVESPQWPVGFVVSP